MVTHCLNPEATHFPCASCSNTILRKRGREGGRGERKGGREGGREGPERSRITNQFHITSGTDNNLFGKQEGETGASN